MTAQIPMLLRPWSPSKTTRSPFFFREPNTLISREDWIAMCIARLVEVGHDGDAAALVLLATDLWSEVGRFDPTIAAEIEHESWAACS